MRPVYRAAQRSDRERRAALHTDFPFLQRAIA
jgi:hypothetical protein